MLLFNIPGAHPLQGDARAAGGELQLFLAQRRIEPRGAGHMQRTSPVGLSVVELFSCARIGDPEVPQGGGGAWRNGWRKGGTKERYQIVKGGLTHMFVEIAVEF